MNEGFRVQREHNWADNYTYGAARIHRPASVAELSRIVANAEKIRAIGSRHSFNGIADSAGDLVDLADLDSDIRIDPQRRCVTVGAATRYATVASTLQRQGFALHNMGSLPHISIAGAIATGTHGSGNRNGNLPTAVSALEMVDADGSIRLVRRGDPGFDGMVVGLGAVGVVTRVTLDIEPSFQMLQHAYAGLPWSAVLTDLQTVMSLGYSVSLFTHWSSETVERLWVKHRLDHPTPGIVPAELGADAAPHPVWDQSDAIAAQLNPFDVAGAWSERLPHFRPDVLPGPGDQIQSEYMVPLRHAMPALARLREMSDRIDRLLHITEIRSMAADTLWMSPSCGDESIAFHFTWVKQPEAVAAITADIEALLLPFGGRPHWGKVIHANAEQIAALYPRVADFKGLATSLDPAGKFRNAFLDRHVFGTHSPTAEA